MQHHHVDILVVGSGLAGLATALSVEGRHVTLLCPWSTPVGASAMAQGGISASVGAADSPDLHAADTLRAGAGACDADAVRVMCAEAAPAVQWLEQHGVCFDRDGDGHALHREAAHSRARVLHVDEDRTGFALTRALTRAARARLNIEFLSGYTAVALTRNDVGISGIVALDRSSAPLRISARETVLATGGLGQLYSHTTNPRTACGDGLAMALTAGARCTALEFVQFHPTALDVDADPLPLVTEALRGAGARLIVANGRSVMDGVHADADLAPRDVIARAAWACTRVGERVSLDATGVFRRAPAAFPTVRALCARHGIDPASSAIPVTTAAHYHMGGIAVDLEGRSSLGHLWACGEVACTGVHGANRLASNSLLEAVVFGRRLGSALSDSPVDPTRPAGNSPEVGDQAMTLDVDATTWGELRRLMWMRAGIERNAAGMRSGLVNMRQLEHAIPTHQVLLRNRLRLATAILSAALARHANCGAHFRSDFRSSEPGQADRRLSGGSFLRASEALGP
ncbi:MAG TPA: FAD-binding protein [Steroidobacteraceae bacterium]|nr:FAD-binding protein [Steroidobacteraceae bacterium]